MLWWQLLWYTQRRQGLQQGTDVTGDAHLDGDKGGWGHAMGEGWLGWSPAVGIGDLDKIGLDGFKIVWIWIWR